MKNVLKVIIFFFIFVCLLLISSEIFVPKQNSLSHFGNRSGRTDRLLAEKENTVDAVFIGDSLVYTSINPMRIYEKQGFTTFDMALSAQYLYESYNNIDKILQNQGYF